MAPRGIGTMAAMLIAGRLSNRVDPRKLMALGVLLLVYSLWLMTSWTPDVDQWTIAWNTIIQGAGLGFVFIPLQVIAFATLAPQFRTNGTALLSLFRNVGSAIGVSVTETLLTRNTHIEHSVLAGYVTPFNRALQGSRVIADAIGPATAHGAAALEQIVERQAAIIAYNDDFRFMMLISIPTLLLLMLMRRPNATANPPEGHAAALD